MDANLRQQLEYDARRKSPGAAYLLWFFLGSFGAHRFYLGRVGTGIAQLLLLLLGWLPLFIGWFVLGIWWIVDAFLIPEIIRRENLRAIDRIARGENAPLPRP